MKKIVVILDCREHGRGKQSREKPETGCENEHRRQEGKPIKHISIQSGLIETMGYEPQYAQLEIRLSGDGRVWQYRDVPEDVWYQLREDRHPDAYFRRYICGRYMEEILMDESEDFRFEGQL